MAVRRGSLITNWSGSFHVPPWAAPPKLGRVTAQSAEVCPRYPSTYPLPKLTPAL
uniref:Uncharacterized protein n=1 Tax=Xenopus tropicalis TaxID=8364 RepID=A0A1B8Y5R4_XENTR